MTDSRLSSAMCAALLVSALAFSTLTHAALISYDESLDGDITSVPTFDLDVGINVISGSRTAIKRLV